MSLASLLNNVISVTKRPDAKAQALVALNTIILEISTKADFGEDLVETSLAVPEPSLTYATLTLPIDPPVRKIEYIKVGPIILKPIKPRFALTNEGCLAQNSYYRSGKNIVITAIKELGPAIEFGYYQVPALVSEESPEHWLLEEAQSMLENAVIARVFAATGDDASYQVYQNIYTALRRQFQTSRGDTEDLAG